MTRALRNATAAVVATLTASAALVAVTAPPGVSAPASPAGAARQTSSLEVGPAEAFSRSAFGHSLVIDRLGNATILWTRSVARPAVLASHRPAGGDWGAWVKVGRGFSPQVEADHRGRVTAVWASPRDALTSARLGSDGSWGPSVRLTSPAGPGGVGRLRGLDLAVAPSGRAILTWSATTGVAGSPRQLFWAVREPGAGWSEPRDVTGPGHPEEPQVELAAGGVATLMYAVQRFGSPRALVARDHVPGQGWGPPTPLGRGGYSSELAVDRAGDAVVVLDPEPGRVAARFRPAGDDWRRPRTLTPPGTEVDTFDLAMNRAGDAVVAWAGDDGEVGASRRSARTPWTGPTSVASAGRSVSFVSAAIGSDADALVAWGSFEVAAAHQPDGAAWSEPTDDITNRDLVLESLDTTTGPDGTTVVVYKHEDTALRARDVRPAP